MKLLLVGNYEPHGQESMQRFANLLLTGISEKNWEICLWKPPIVLARRKWHRSIEKWIFYLDQYLLAPVSLMKNARHVDLVHICDHSNAMYGAVLRGKPWLITCHDLLAVRVARGEFPGQTVRASGRALQRWILSSISNAPFIVCDSEATQTDLLRLSGVSRNRTEVIPCAPNRTFSRFSKAIAGKVLAEGNIPLPSQFFLHIGGNQWYKNRVGVIRTFSEILKLSSFKNHYLILAGKPLTSGMSEEIKSLGISDRIIELCHVSNDTVDALYALATALIFPSIAEGFGWPILEAQLLGCPVFTTACEPMGEIGGKRSAVLSPTDHLANAKMISEGLKERSQMIAEGFASSSRFSTATMILRYLSRYQMVMTAPNHEHR